jgi:inner membrane protein
VDPVTHTFTGAALSAAGLRRATPLAAAALILGANAPDVDIVSAFVGNPFTSLAFRRGWTHGPLAWLVLPVAVAAVLLGYDRWVRRRRHPDLEPARAGPLIALAAIGVATHPFLDWLNNYGLRWLMPFDARWFYGDSVFIVDPWIWLLLGGGLFLMDSRTRSGMWGWGVFAFAATALVLGPGVVPAAAKALWLVGLAGLVLARRRIGGSSAVVWPARAGLTGAAAYIGLAIAGTAIARHQVLTVARNAGIQSIEHVMVAPVPADPLGGTVVIATRTSYYNGTFHWLRSPRTRLEPRPQVILPPGAEPMVAAASTVPEARDYLVWARFPFYRVTAQHDGYRVRIGDARYQGTPSGASLQGLEIRLDTQLRPVAETR